MTNMQSNTPLKNLLMQFVRNRDEFSIDDYEIITAPDNVEQCYQFLLEMKRDIESQFIAHRSRKMAVYVDCEQAKLEGEFANVWLDEDTPEGGLPEGTKRQKVMQSLPADIAYAKFMAQENHWKVKILRFLALIESALADIKAHMHPYDTSAIAKLVEVVKRHEQTNPDEANKPDEDLYEVLHQIES